MLRRRVTGLVLAAALLIPTISTAAQNHRAPMTSWWKSLITWVAHVTGYATDPTSSRSRPSVNLDGSAIIDPNG